MLSCLPVRPFPARGEHPAAHSLLWAAYLKGSFFFFPSSSQTQTPWLDLILAAARIWSRKSD